MEHLLHRLYGVDAPDDTYMTSIDNKTINPKRHTVLAVSR